MPPFASGIGARSRRGRRSGNERSSGPSRTTPPFGARHRRSVWALEGVTAQRRLALLDGADRPGGGQARSPTLRIARSEVDSARRGNAQQMAQPTVRLVDVAEVLAVSRERAGRITRWPSFPKPVE